MEEDRGAFGVGCEEDGVRIIGEDGELGLIVCVPSRTNFIVSVGVLVPHFDVTMRFKVVRPVWKQHV